MSVIPDGHGVQKEQQCCGFAADMAGACCSRYSVLQFVCEPKSEHLRDIFAFHVRNSACECVCSSLWVSGFPMRIENQEIAGYSRFVV